MKIFLHAVLTILLVLTFYLLFVGLLDFAFKQIFIDQRNDICFRAETVGTKEHDSLITDVRPVYICNY